MRGADRTVGRRTRVMLAIVPALALLVIVTMVAQYVSGYIAHLNAVTARAVAQAADPVPQVSETSTAEVDAAERQAYIDEWAARIDDYLAGSPLEGQGVTFATASWKYGVDARWSPAIATVESGKGANCYYSHNAGGWGMYSWDSWEEAIDAHVKGLSEYYGPTNSLRAAYKYNATDPENWYYLVQGEMDSI